MRAMLVTGPLVADWNVIDTDASLESLQGYVGGLIEAVPLDSDAATVFCNDEGRLLGLPVYTVSRLCGPLCGPLVILGGTGPDGETLPLDDEALAAVVREVFPVEVVERALERMEAERRGEPVTPLA